MIIKFNSINSSGLTISGQNYYEVKEGENLDVICTPSPETVGLEWELPQTVVSNEATTVVQYREPLRHTLTIRMANINHNGSYTCSVMGYERGVISPITASVRVLESKKFKLHFFISYFILNVYRVPGRFFWWCLLGRCL